MDNIEKKLDTYIKYFPKDFLPKVAIVLGTRLCDFVECMDIIHTVNFSDVEGFPRATGYGHKGRFVCGYVKGIPVIVSDGRLHFYEGYNMKEVVLNIRIMRRLGAKFLIETNISGIVNPSFEVGDIMLIEDHISSFVPSPLVGVQPRKRSERFVDMSSPYDKTLNEIVLKCAERNNITLQRGVYLQVSGPNYETSSEVRMYRALGADAVGMSTACEVITAKQLEMCVCGLSYLSNFAGAYISENERCENLRKGREKSSDVFCLLQEIICAIENGMKSL